MAEWSVVFFFFLSVASRQVIQLCCSTAAKTAWQHWALPKKAYQEAGRQMRTIEGDPGALAVLNREGKYVGVVMDTDDRPVS